jgi:hypothetical protein
MRFPTPTILTVLTALAQPVAAQAEGLFAAIAFSPGTGMSGTAWNYDTSGLAEAEAGAQCGQGDCATVLVFQHCGAIAVGDGFGYGYGADLSQSSAIDIAMQNCAGFTTGCEVTAAFCNEGY